MRRPNESWSSFTSRLCKIVNEREKERKKTFYINSM